MADRYWVGGTGTWNTTNTANWSATSGGASGASAPTSADNVIFDTNSGTGTINVAAYPPCLNFTVTATQALVFSGGGITPSGNVTLPSGGSTDFTGFVPSVRGPGTSMTTNGKVLGGFEAKTGAGNTFSLNDAVNVGTSYFAVTTGTLNTNNFNITCGYITSTGTIARVFNLGSSTVTASATNAVAFTGSNLTFNAGTSTINCTSSSAITFAGLSQTFYNVNFTGGGTTTIAVTGANTFNNLSVTANAAGTKNITFDSTTTLNGTLSTSGTSSTQRIQFGSSVAGTQRTLSVATIGTLTNTNWKDIALTGAASPWTAPLGVFDLGNNTGITFDTTTLYWVGGTGSWTDSSKWATSSGGAGGAGVPGPTNNVFLDANSGTGSVTGNSGTPPNYCKDFDCSAASVSTLFSNVWLYCYGSFKAKSGAINGFTSLVFYGSGTHTVDPNGSTNMSSPGGFDFRGTGTYTLMNNWVSSNVFAHYSGTLNTNGYSVSGNLFSCNGNLTRTLNLGASTLTFNSSTSFDFSGTNLTLNAGTSTLVCGAAFNAGTGNTFYNVTFTNTSPAGSSTITGANTYNNLTLSAPSSAGVVRFYITANQTVNGTFTVPGLDGNRRIAVIPSDSVTQRTITASAVSLTDVNFVKIAGAGTATWSGTRLSNGGGNSGITFDTPKTVYWNLPAGGSYIGNAWATTSGGSVATTNFPLGQDTAIIEDTGLNSGATINNFYTGTVLPNLSFATRTLPMTLNIADNPYAAGDITLSSSVTRTGTQVVYFSGNTTLISAGVTWTNAFYVTGTLTIGDNTSCTGGAYTIYSLGVLNLNANLTLSVSLLNSCGTINLNSYILTARQLTCDAAYLTIPTFNCGTGKFVLTGNGMAVISLTSNGVFTGSKLIEVSYSGATGTRTVAQSIATPSNRANMKVTNGTDIISISGNFNDADFTGFSGTLNNTAYFISGNLTIATGMTLASGTSAVTFDSVSGTKTITTNGKTLDFPITFNGVGGTWQLADNLTQGSTRATTLTNGTLDLNGKTYIVGSFATAAGTKNLTFNGGILSCVAGGGASAFNNAQPTNFTTTAGTGTGKISMAGTTAKTFVGGGSTYNCTLEQSGAGQLQINGSNAFNNIANTVQPVTIVFQAGTTNTFNNFSLSGTSGNLVTIGSASAANHTLSKSTGEVNVSYCSISRSTATGGATWKAYTSNGNVDGGNNSGWLFSESSGNGLLFGSNF